MYDPQDVAGLEEDTTSLYMWAEVSILVVLRDLMQEQLANKWSIAQAVSMVRRKREIKKIVNKLDEVAPKLITKAVGDAYQKGHDAATIEATKVLKEQEQGRSRAEHVVDASKQRKHVKEAVTAVTKIHKHIPTRVDNIWRTIIRDAVALGETKNLTPQQSAQYALTRFTKEGLPFYTDKAGRRWGLDTYAEMAVRTETNNALRDGYTNELRQSGIDLVIVSSHKNPAPVCAPFERQILSLGEHKAGSHDINGKTVRVKATLNEAVRSGLYHPNCRHRVTAFVPGYTSTTKTTPPDPGHAGYKATQTQRYYERQIRASIRMEHVALDEDTKRKAIARRKLYQKKLREHIKQWDLPRRPHRERLRTPDELLLDLDKEL